jgi:hypothetical protein
MSAEATRTRFAEQLGGPLPEVDGRAFLENHPAGPAETRVLEVVGDHVLIDPPRMGGRELDLPVHMRLALGYESEHIPCMARTLVSGPPPKASGGPWLRILRVERQQRRGAVRVPVTVPLAVTVRGEKGESWHGITEDLSAGGVLARFEEAPPKGPPLVLVMDLGDGGPPFTLPGRIVRRSEEPRSARPWAVAFAFGSIERAVEDRLTRIVFQRQRELLSRERGLA